jgi:DNA polymerase I
MVDTPPSILKKLVLLDSMALIYRAHFALVRSPRFTSGGVCTSAIFGVANTLLDIIKREEPTHIAAAFDTSDPTARHAAFPEYKAQRDAMPEDISAQLPWIDRLFDAFNITRIRMPGYEADDIIGTLAHQAAEAGFETLMVTPDKDYDQLVRDNVYVWKPGRKGSEFELLGVPEVLAKWEIERVEQVIDVLGLMGDSSDNIPGIPGIGPKTAQKMIADFGSIEALIANSDKLKGKVKERVQENIEKALLSKRLVTIQLDVPHHLDIESFRWKSHDDAALKQLLSELEFDTLGKRIFGNTFSSSASRATVVREKREAEIQASLFDGLSDELTLADVRHKYTLVNTAEERRLLIEDLLQASEICFDTETTGLDPRIAFPLGISFAFAKHEAFYVVLPEASAISILEEFRCVLENEKISKIGHNLKYDCEMLKWHGFDVKGPLFDTMLAHSMKEPEMRHGLDYLAKLYLNYIKIKTTDLLGEPGEKQLNMRDVPIERVGQYACEDADITLQLAHVIRADIETQGVSRVCYEVECPLVPVLVDMEREGIRLDIESLHTFSLKLESEIALLRDKIFTSAGHEFNIDSPKQLGVVLYEEMQLEANPKKTATGQYSTRESELERLAARHQIIADILDYRSAVKLKSVYVDQLPNSVNADTGRLHTHYSQAWTTTGRMQSIDPNLQTIPIRKKLGREIRAAFVPRDENYSILSADYSQIELRVMADLSKDEAMVEAFNQGIDIHSVTASKVFKVAPEDVTREMRDKAKTVNFGIIYGISGFGLQQRLNIPRAEANDLIRNYFAEYPRVREYIDATIAFAKENGYVQTQTGRRRFLRDINSRSRTVVNASERLAMNSPIQGTAADILKLAMIRVHRALRDGHFKTKMLLTVHDEIVFDMLNTEQETVVPVILHAMTGVLEMSVPLVVEYGIGKNWLEAH